MSTIQPITKKQKEILLLLYTFRYLTTHHLQNLLHHKNPNRILAWVKDLEEKKYIGKFFSRKTFIVNGKPSIYYLETNARYVLKDNSRCKVSLLNYLYKEKARDKKFIDHNLSLADVYLFFLSQKKETEEVTFITNSLMHIYTFLPEIYFDAYIEVKTTTCTKYYFLYLFDEHTPSWVYRKRVREYFELIAENTWTEKTNTSIPYLLMICPSEQKKKHVDHYTKSLLEKTFDDVQVFLATKDLTKSRTEKLSIWQKVKV